MKKAILFLITPILFCLLCSCSSNNQSDTFFVHSAGFESVNEEISVTVLLEKHGKDSNDYFTATSTASSINEAAEKIMSEYSECYFATCDLYFISDKTNQNAISDIAKDICDSNIFPTTGHILCVNQDKVQNFMGGIKNDDIIRQIKKDSSKEAVNVASFFAKYSSDKSITLDAFSFKNGQISKNGKKTFTKG